MDKKPHECDSMIKIVPSTFIVDEVPIGLDIEEIRTLEISVAEKTGINLLYVFRNPKVHEDFTKFRRSTFEPIAWSTLIGLQIICFSLRYYFWSQEKKVNIPQS